MGGDLLRWHQGPLWLRKEVCVCGGTGSTGWGPLGTLKGPWGHSRTLGEDWGHLRSSGDIPRWHQDPLWLRRVVGVHWKKWDEDTRGAVGRTGGH